MTREEFWEWLNTYQGEYRIEDADVGSVVINFWFEEKYEEVA